MASAFKYLMPGLGSYLMPDPAGEKTLNGEENELRAVAESSLTFSDTETGPTVDTSDEKSANGTDENLRNPEFLDLTERYSRELENNFTMKAEVQQYEKRLKEQEEQHQAVLRSKEDEFQKFYNRHKEQEEQHQAVLRSKEDEFQKFCNRKRRLENKIEELKNSLKDVKAENQRMEIAYKSLGKKLDNYRKRLASGFEKRLKQDQRRVENTVEFNTPTDVEKAFMDFFDGERIDACDVMETTLKPEEMIELDIYYPRLACIIFVTAYEQVKEAREAACDLFENVTRQLIDETPKLSQELCLNRKEGGCSAHFPITFDVSVAKKNQEISTDVVDGLMLCLKQTAHLCNLDFFENDVKEIVWERWQKHLHEEGKPLLPALSQDVLIELSDYIKACIRLTWRMVTQMPPLQIEYKSIKFDKDIHRLTRSQCNTEYSHSEDQPCGEVHNENIACYMWPALLEGGGRIIFPGEVLCELEPANFDFLVI